MADADCREFRKKARHVCMKSRAAHARVGLPVRNASAEQDPATVRRGAIIIDHLARVAHDAVLGNQPLDHACRKRLCCDHVAADRDHSPSEPGCEFSGVAICSDHYVLGTAGAALGSEAEARAISLDSRHDAVRDDFDSGRYCALQEATVISGGIQGCVARQHDPSVVRVGAHFGALLVPRHQLHWHFKSLWLGSYLPNERLEVTRAVRRVETTDDAEIAVNAFRSDELADPTE